MNERSLVGKIALVTGAGSTVGLGRAMTLALVRAGAKVAMMDLDSAALQQSASDAREVGGNDCVATIIGDVTKPEDAERAVKSTISELGGLHVLVNNAGINPRVEPGDDGLTFSRIPLEAWMSTIAVNVNGPFFMARAATPHLVKQGWGRIIGITTSLDTMIRGGPGIRGIERCQWPTPHWTILGRRAPAGRAPREGQCPCRLAAARQTGEHQNVNPLVVSLSNHASLDRLSEYPRGGFGVRRADRMSGPRWLDNRPAIAFNAGCKSGPLQSMQAAGSEQGESVSLRTAWKRSTVVMLTAPRLWA